MTAGTNKELARAILPYRSLRDQQSVNGTANLVDLEKMMALYRLSRDHPKRKSTIPASNIVHAIFSSTERRRKILAGLHPDERKRILSSQNATMIGYIHEILEDIFSNKAYLSTVALVDLIVILKRTGHAQEIKSIFDKLKDLSASQALVEVVERPEVVSAVLCYADPETIDLEDVKKIYDEAKKKHGSSLPLEEALTTVYLRFSDPIKVSNMYADIVANFSPQAGNSESIGRLHNRILEETTDAEMGLAFFKMGLQKDSHIPRLYPNSVGRFLEHYYQKTKNFDNVAKLFLSSCVYYRANLKNAQIFSLAPLITSLWSIFFHHYQEDTESGRERFMYFVDKFEQMYPYPQNLILFNLGFRNLVRNWGFSFANELVDSVLGKKEKIPVETCQVLLTSHPSLDVTRQIWKRRLKSPKHLNRYDFIELVNGADTPEKVKFVQEELKRYQGSLEDFPENPLLSCSPEGC